MKKCPECGARLGTAAEECFQCHTRLRPLPESDEKRAARWGTLQSFLALLGIALGLFAAVIVVIELVLRRL